MKKAWTTKDFEKGLVGIEYTGKLNLLVQIFSEVDVRVNLKVIQDLGNKNIIFAVVKKELRIFTTKILSPEIPYVQEEEIYLLNI